MFSKVDSSKIITYVGLMLLTLSMVLSTAQNHQANAQVSEVPDCTQTCRWVRSGIIFKRECKTEVPDFPRGRPPSCYRADWDFDDDGVMEIRTEAEAEAAANSSSHN